MAQFSVLSSVFDTIGGIPVHPLAVHFAVVLVPIGALALIVLAILPKLRKTYLPVTVGVLAVGTAFTFIAKESGEQLAERVGNPTTHAALGDILFPTAVGLLLLGIAMLVLSRSERPKWQLQTASGLAVVAAVAVSTLTFFVGHSGAEATWANKVSVAQLETSNSGSEQSASSEISLEELAKHNTPEDCWIAVDGQVADITNYLNVHPGGAGFLKQLCGTDATAAFSSQHSGQQTPMAQLESLIIGTLAASTEQTNGSATQDENSTATGTVAALTAAEVAKHTSTSDCWSVVSGNVYDLSSYANSHPGGAGAISALCGKDATAAFQGQHGGASRPNSTLAAFLLGPLAASADSTALPGATAAGEEENEHSEGEDDDD